MMIATRKFGDTAFTHDLAASSKVRLQDKEGNQVVVDKSDLLSFVADQVRLRKVHEAALMTDEEVFGLRGKWV